MEQQYEGKTENCNKHSSYVGGSYAPLVERLIHKTASAVGTSRGDSDEYDTASGRRSIRRLWDKVESSQDGNSYAESRTDGALAVLNCHIAISSQKLNTVILQFQASL